MSVAAEEYQKRWPKLADSLSRKRKAEKILASLSTFYPKDISQLTCLDLGCGSGIIAAHMSESFAHTYACDFDRDAITFARTNLAADRVAYFVADATEVPLADESCDVIVCCHVYEHVADAVRLMDEIERLLKRDGVCFFSGPNALRFYEPHLRLPLIHWLPRPVTNRILRLLARPPYGERLRSWWGLRSLLRKFSVRDLNPELVRHPETFHVADEPMVLVCRHFPSVILRPVLTLFSPSFNLLLTTSLHG